ncbi:MAG: cytochrome c [Gammaproteobacteria bacterium]
MLRRCVAICLFAFLSGVPLVRAADIFKGGEIYAKHCQSCHGADGKGVMPGTSDLTRGRGMLRPDAQLFTLIEAGKGVMPGYRGVLRNAEILDVIAYMRTLR